MQIYIQFTDKERRMKRIIMLLIIFTAALPYGAHAARDKTPPLTTASPTGGTYTNSVTVSLSANERATTYYCKGSGCTPTTIYSSPLALSATTTLRYYSKDR